MKFKDKRLIIDYINMLIGIVILVIAVIAFRGGAGFVGMFPLLFALGTVMLILNTVKTFPDNKFLGAMFGLLAVVMAAGFVISIVMM